MQIEIIANPFSGRGRGPERASRIAELLSARGHSVGVHIGRSRQDGIQWAQNAAKLADRLVVVGGDGTLNSVMNGLPAEDAPPLALSPLGTANMLAQELKISRRPEDTVTLVERGERQLIDIPTVSYQSERVRRTRRCFLCMGFGYDGELMRLMQAQRDGPIHPVQYIKVLAEAMRSWTPVPQEIIADDQPVGEYSYGILSGVSIYGSTILRLGRCNLQDGLWELFLFRNVDLLRGGLFALAAAGGQLEKLPDVRRLPVRKVRIQGKDNAPVQVDGDYVGHTPLEFSIDGMQVPLLVARP
ncbi:MAG: diacylglycerol kinase family protein [Planctomycetota bacterium]|nr:diacylglycerol kinase family protein [Planctomycetota bacterium]MDA1112778.1 diacylglycerol kinase family protein [Planctomycetota bacterium]